MKRISRPALQRLLSQELEMAMLLQLTLQTPPAAPENKLTQPENKLTQDVKTRPRIS